jgi:hypothetical protein
MHETAWMDACVQHESKSIILHTLHGVANPRYIGFANLKDYGSIMAKNCRIISCRYLLEKLRGRQFYMTCICFKFCKSIAHSFPHCMMQNLLAFKCILKNKNKS